MTSSENNQNNHLKTETGNKSDIQHRNIIHTPKDTISTEAQQIINMLRDFKHKGFTNEKAETGTPEEKHRNSLLRMVTGRHDMDQMSASRPLPDGISVTSVLADGVPCEWQRWIAEDPEKQSDKVLLFLHGGGFSGGSALTRRVMSLNIVRQAKVDALSVDYRLSPEYRFPAALDDCETAYVWLLKQGYKPWNIFISGESAGANLTVTLVHYLKAHSLPIPGGICPVSPVVDITDAYPSRVLRANRDPMIGPFIDESDIPSLLTRLTREDVSQASHYCGTDVRTSPFVSPIHGDFSGFPKMMIHVGSEEILYDDSIALEEKAHIAGVDVQLHEWTGLFHSFPIFAFPEADEACGIIATFIRSV